MKKIIVCILLLVVYFLGLSGVLAKEATVISLPEEGYYFERIGPNHYHSARFHKYSFNGQVAYCIEPGISITEEIYEEHQGLETGPFDEETMKKIELIGYYGYGYPDHDTIQYRIATQELIWTTVSDYTFAWNDKKNGEGNTIDISKEKNETMRLVNNHYQKPSFDNSILEVVKDKEIILKDTNHVLNQYQILGSKNSNAMIHGDELIVKLEEDTDQIQLIKKQWSDRKTFIYTNTGQTMATFGLTYPVTSTITLSTLKTKVKVQKIDAETRLPIYQEEIRFKIKNNNTNEYVCSPSNNCEYITDKNGVFITDFPLEAGSYQIEEVNQKIEGYLWNSNPLSFIIDENTIFKNEGEERILELSFENTPVKGTIELHKVGEKIVLENNTYSYQEIPLHGVQYELYANENITDTNSILYNKDDKIGSYQTINGLLKISNLPLGKYYLKEIKSTDNHLIDNEKLFLELSYQDQYTKEVTATIHHKNYLKKGFVEFIKKDIETSQPLPNTCIQIIDDIQNIVIYEGKTNKEGKIILDNLYLGKFYIIEKQPPENYELSLEKVFFEIKENDEQIKASMTNHLIVTVPATNQNKTNFLSIYLLLLGGLGIFYEKKRL